MVWEGDNVLMLLMMFSLKEKKRNTTAPMGK
jgi:hypothetical protein